LKSFKGIILDYSFGEENGFGNHHFIPSFACPFDYFYHREFHFNSEITFKAALDRILLKYFFISCLVSLPWSRSFRSEHLICNGPEN
jgi:hypothetical protein